MKLICENIIVRCVGEKTGEKTGERPIAGQNEPQPQAIFWQGRMYRVSATTSTWRWRGSWWATPALQGQERTYFRVLCVPPGGGNDSELCLELYRERGRWMLSRLLD